MFTAALSPSGSPSGLIWEERALEELLLLLSVFRTVPRCMQLHASLSPSRSRSRSLPVAGCNSILPQSTISKVGVYSFEGEQEVKFSILLLLPRIAGLVSQSFFPNLNLNSQSLRSGLWLAWKNQESVPTFCISCDKKGKTLPCSTWYTLVQIWHERQPSEENFCLKLTHCKQKMLIPTTINAQTAWRLMTKEQQSNLPVRQISQYHNSYELNVPSSYCWIILC